MADYIVNAEIHLRLTEHHEEECRQEGMSTQDIIRETLMEKFALTSDRMLSDPIVVRLVDWSVRPDGLEPENQGGNDNMKYIAEGPEARLEELQAALRIVK